MQQKLRSIIVLCTLPFPLVRRGVKLCIDILDKPPSGPGAKGRAWHEHWSGPCLGGVPTFSFCFRLIAYLLLLALPVHLQGKVGQGRGAREVQQGV